MLLPTALLAPVLPTGTMTTTAVCRWLSERTGVVHRVGTDLRDYPVFLAVRSGEPGRVERLVASALVGHWERSGGALRLVPTKPKASEVDKGFAARYRAATEGKGALAELPPGEIEAMRVGTILCFGPSEGAYVRPLPAAARAKAGVRTEDETWVYLMRVTYGRFIASVVRADGDDRSLVKDEMITFRDPNPAVAALLGDARVKPVYTAGELAERQRRLGLGEPLKIDWKRVDAVDPLAAMADPWLRPVAAAVGVDLAVALPDLCLLGIGGKEPETLGEVFERVGQADDLSVEDGAVVGRLTLSERRYPTQARREAVADYVLRARATGTFGATAMGAYLAAQPSGASEARTDLAWLALSGAMPREFSTGDYPYNVRLMNALTEPNWRLLRTGKGVRMADVTPEGRAAMVDLLANSYGRMTGETSDPVTWKGFAEGRLTLAGKIMDYKAVFGDGPNGVRGMGANEAGYLYDAWKSASGKEPLYRSGGNRELWLTISPDDPNEGVETRLADLTVAPDAKAVPWGELPSQTKQGFEIGLKQRRAQAPVPAKP